MKEIFYQLPHIKLCTLQHDPQFVENKTNIKTDVVLALHGWLDNANSFLPMMTYNNSFTVIAVELAGHGNSAHRGQDNNYQLLDYVYDLYALIKQNNWNKVHLVGHSLGAIVACVFAGTFPELIDKLVLIEALGPITADADETRQQLRKSISTRYKAQTRIPSNKGYSSIEQAIQARLMVSDFNEEITSMLVTRSLKKIDDKYRWKSDPRLKQLSPIKMMESQAIDLLSGIIKPTLLILGEDGYPSLRTKLGERIKVLPSINLLTFAGGHHVHMQQPALVWKAIEQHISN